MDVIGKLLDTQITILALILVGYVLSKRKLLSTEFRKAMTGLVIRFILPCNIIKSFMMDFNGEIMRSCLAVCAVWRLWFITTGNIQCFDSNETV